MILLNSLNLGSPGKAEFYPSGTKSVWSWNARGIYKKNLISAMAGAARWQKSRERFHSPGWRRKGQSWVVETNSSCYDWKTIFFLDLAAIVCLSQVSWELFWILSRRKSPESRRCRSARWSRLCEIYSWGRQLLFYSWRNFRRKAAHDASSSFSHSKMSSAIRTHSAMNQALLWKIYLRDIGFFINLKLRNEYVFIRIQKLLREPGSFVYLSFAPFIFRVWRFNHILKFLDGVQFIY